MAVTKQFAVEIDTELSNLYNEEWNIKEKIFGYQDSLEFYIKNPKYANDNVAHYEKQIEILKQKLVPIKKRQRELNEIYNQDPWTRAYLVVSSVGHVHKDMYCSTCFPQTRYQWLVQYSNDDEKTIVEDAGQDACTVCYPSAPAEVLNRPSRIVTADKIAKAQAKAEREEKKAQRIAKEKANAPTASGEFLYFKRGKYTEVIKTERSAVTEWFNLQWQVNKEIVTHYYDGQPHSQESLDNQQRSKDEAQEKADIIAKNLAEKHGVSFEQELKILHTKYKKRGL